MNEPLRSEKKELRTERLLILAALAAVLVLLGFFLKDILIPFVRMELRNDFDGAKSLLRDKGILGCLTVTLVEALQMIVIFIPAEFIQISSGLSYPFYVALPLCDLGVCLGATIIFVLVRAFRLSNPVFEKRRRAIDRISEQAHARSVTMILYLLFFMPIIPFGAICYYGSGTKLSYGRYIRTVATGVIPSIVVSNLMGAAGRAFLANDLPIWLLIVILAVLAAALFVLIFLFLDRLAFKDCDGTPDSLMYALIFLIVRLWRGKRQRVTAEDALLREAEPPYVLLANHESFFDFYYLSQMDHPKNPTYLVNEFYTTRPILKTMARKAGILSKKLFAADMAAPLGIARALREGWPVVIFPEGRLSPDGRSNPIVEPGGRFYKKLGADLVLVKLRGAYFTAPKWRRRSYRGAVRVTVERVVKKDELKALSAAELDALISETLCSDASETPVSRFPQRGRAKGLENLLYRCPDCGALYTTETRDCTLRCSACGAAHRLSEQYRFDDGAGTIGDCYARIREAERAELRTLDLQTPVKTKIFPPGGGRARFESGECRLTPEGFTYRGESGEFFIPIEKLPALAFSCAEEFELYLKNELHYFYPLENRRQTARWALAVDLLRERREGGNEP